MHKILKYIYIYIYNIIYILPIYRHSCPNQSAITYIKCVYYYYYYYHYYSILCTPQSVIFHYYYYITQIIQIKINYLYISYHHTSTYTLYHPSSFLTGNYISTDISFIRHFVFLFIFFVVFIIIII